LQGTTIAQLAEAKHLNPDYLYEELGWRDVKYFGTSAISIPYASETNNDVQVRFRVGLDEGDRFRWDRGANPRMYGLWNLEVIKAQNYVILVEGETDYDLEGGALNDLLNLAGSSVPMPISDFEEELRKRHFTTGGDRDHVANMYSRYFKEVAEEMTCYDLHPGEGGKPIDMRHDTRPLFEVVADAMGFKRLKVIPTGGSDPPGRFPSLGAKRTVIVFLQVF